MDKPVMYLKPGSEAEEEFYAFIGRVSLLLVEENIDAITATNFLREIAEAKNSGLDAQQAMRIAKNYVDVRSL